MITVCIDGKKKKGRMSSNLKHQLGPRYSILSSFENSGLNLSLYDARAPETAQPDTSLATLSLEVH